LLPPIASRAGFLDFSAEIIAHREQYASVLSASFYGKSIIDNLLTPGFDVFDAPKVSNALQFIYRDWGVPSKQQVDEYYQSDQLGIYGEFYALFRYGSLPVLFLVAALLKQLYVRVGSRDPFVLAMLRVLILTVFLWTIDSFGFDWTLGEAIPFVASIIIYRACFAARRVARSGVRSDHSTTS
jgi:hypothetical protein